MELETLRKIAERKLCNEGEELKCEPVFEAGENNFMPFQKVSWVCRCKARKKDDKRKTKQSPKKCVC